MLRTLLSHADEDPQVARLAQDGGRAFVSQSLRPYLLAALLNRDPDRPTIAPPATWRAG
jgi:transcription-repair coupling factor (superfamily II helicase)